VVVPEETASGVVMETKSLKIVLSWEAMVNFT
jgi:hypothetical protein